MNCSPWKITCGKHSTVRNNYRADLLDVFCGRLLDDPRTPQLFAEDAITRARALTGERFSLSPSLSLPLYFSRFLALSLPRFLALSLSCARSLSLTFSIPVALSLSLALSHAHSLAFSISLPLSFSLFVCVYRSLSLSFFLSLSPALSLLLSCTPVLSLSLSRPWLVDDPRMPLLMTKYSSLRMLCLVPAL